MEKYIAGILHIQIKCRCCKQMVFMPAKGNRQRREIVCGSCLDGRGETGTARGGVRVIRESKTH